MPTKNWQDRHAKKAGEYEVKRRARRAGLIQHQQETPDYALRGAVGPKPTLKMPEKKHRPKESPSVKPGFFKRMFRRVTGG